MTTDNHFLLIATAQPWWDPWRGNVREWLLTSGLHIILLLIGAVLAARCVNWLGQKVTEGLGGYAESDALERSEASKHRQTVASLISWVSVVVIAIVVAVQLADILNFSVRGFVAPATVVGAALGFGAQQLVKDLLSGLFIILEKQYGFGDLVTLTIVSATEASGTVENVTLRVTRLRSSTGELLTIPNGQIVQSVNLSKD
ncbi:MAG: mechanosensitive ion channel, partial [Mycobacterium sp.]|nr:mechanosensitive ion channel [Mycobacterium sp.]